MFIYFYSCDGNRYLGESMCAKTVVKDQAPVTIREVRTQSKAEPLRQTKGARSKFCCRNLLQSAAEDQHSSSKTCRECREEKTKVPPCFVGKLVGKIKDEVADDP